MSATGDHPMDDVLAMARGHWVSLVLRAAVELGVLETLLTPTTLPDLAVAAGSDPSALRRLLRVLDDLELVEARPEGRLGLTPRGRLLTSADPARLDTLVRMRTVLPNLAAWQRLAEAVRGGRDTFGPANGRTLWEWLSEDPVEGATFDAAMARRGPAQARALTDAVDLTSTTTVVDVGGGRGAMLTALLRAVPGLRGLVADRPGVVAEALRQFEAAGLAERAGGQPTDFMESVPAGGDAYVLANVLHDWDDEDCVRILANVRLSMPAHGRLLVVEHVLDAPGLTERARRELHLLDLHMLVMFGARERSAEEYRSLIEAAGFSAVVVHTTTTDWQVVEATPAGSG